MKYVYVKEDAVDRKERDCGWEEGGALYTSPGDEGSLVTWLIFPSTDTERLRDADRAVSDLE